MTDPLFQRFPVDRRYRPPPGLGSPHLQSMLASFRLRRPLVEGRARSLLAGSQSVLLECADGVRLMGEYTPGAGRGLVVLIHGWEGSASSLYIIGAGAELFAEGYDVFRLNLRDHGPTHHLNEGLFHSCLIDEAVAAAAAIEARYAPKAMHLVGFSLGGNFALRIAARAPAAGIGLGRVVAVCPVLDPVRTMHRLETGWFGYRQYFLAKWRRSLKLKQSLFPHRYRFGDLRGLATLTATTEFFVEHYTDFAHIDDYLNGYAITGDALAGLAVPSRILFARDDPVIPAEDLLELACPDALEVVLTEAGGHCGFLADWQLRSWVNGAIAETLAEQPFGAPAANGGAAAAGYLW